MAVDAYLLALFCFHIAFERIAEKSSTIRSMVDDAGSSMMELGMSESTVKRLLRIMTDICDYVKRNPET